MVEFCVSVVVLSVIYFEQVVVEFCMSVVVLSVMYLEQNM
jgi:hypothetical protein